MGEERPKSGLVLTFTYLFDAVVPIFNVACQSSFWRSFSFHLNDYLVELVLLRSISFIGSLQGYPAARKASRRGGS